MYNKNKLYINNTSFYQSCNIDHKMKFSFCRTLDLNPWLQLRTTRLFTNKLTCLIYYFSYFLLIDCSNPLLPCLSLCVLSCIWWYEDAWHACVACARFGAHALHVMHDSHHAHLSFSVWNLICHKYDDINSYRK